MGELRCRGIVLKVRQYREADRLVTMLTHEAGMVTVVARGTRKAKSKLAALVEPLTLGYYQLHRGRSSLCTLLEGEIIKTYRKLHGDLTLLSYAQYFGELCHFLLPEYEPAEQVFILLLTALAALEEDPLPDRVARCFELNLLELLGYRPALEGCQHCGGPGPFFFDAVRGGLVCRKCPVTPAGFPVSGAAVAVMKRFLVQGFHRLAVCRLPAPQSEEIMRVTMSLLNVSLGEKKFRSLEVLHGLKRFNA